MKHFARIDRKYSIQIDGASEFMEDFEKDCEESNIQLFAMSHAKLT